VSRHEWENLEELAEDFADVSPDTDSSDAASEPDDGAQAASFTSDDEIDYDLRGSNQEDWSIRSMTSRMRRSTDDSPVRYPEGSLGAFSTPEDYEAHIDNIVEPREEEPQEIEYDDPILLFPPDEMDDDFYRSTYSETARPRLENATEDGDLDDSIGISFSRYTAENKEGEFFFMPFLDIPDESEAEDFDNPVEEEEEEVTFSFRKVDADQVKKEKEFIFMPFLNTSDETPSDILEDGEEEELHNRRSSKGTIFDEGLYLIPLESEDEEEEHTEAVKSEDEDEDDTGISFVSAVGGVVPRVPKVEGTGEKKTSLKKEEAPPPAAGKKKKKRPPAASKAGSRKPQPKQSGKKDTAGSKKNASGAKNSAAEEQFRAAMRNVSPEIRAAVKNDPVQRAALEQAVRIALVQQAAQEAVEKATGRPVFGGFSGGGKKKRPPRAPQQRTGPNGNNPLGGSSRAKTVNFSPFSLRSSYDDGGVSEFGVSPESGSSASEFGASSAAATVQTTPPPAQQTAPPQTQQTTPPGLGMPDNNQDPVLALLNGALDNKPGAAPGAEAAARDGRRSAAYQSPAAVRAAMRTGLDVDAPAQPAAVSATGPKTVMSAAERELQVKRSGCLIWIIVAFVVFFIGLIGILVMPNISKQSDFDSAVNLMEQGRYVQAIEKFETFTRDDTKYYEDCRINISNCAYMQANVYFTEGKYYEAYNILVDKAEFNDETKALALRALYQHAEQRYAEEDWENAATAYINLLGEEYEDAQEKYSICQYQMAMKLVEQKEFMQAYQIFTTLGDYSDSRFQSARMIYETWNADALSITGVQLIDAIDVMLGLGSPEASAVVEKIYNSARDYASNGDHKVAYETFVALGGYSDSRYKAAQELYYVWEKDVLYGSLAQRRDAMEVLRDRAETDEQAANMLRSAGFNQIRLLGKWSDGDSSMTISIAEGTADKFVINLDLASVNNTRVTLQSSDVIFDGNVVYRFTEQDGELQKRGIFQVISFDTLTENEPNSVTFNSFLNNRDYSFERQQ